MQGNRTKFKKIQEKPRECNKKFKKIQEILIIYYFSFPNIESKVMLAA